MEQEFKRMIQEAVREETRGLREEIRQLEELIATERISLKETKRILGLTDQRTVKNHLSKAGIEPVYDENGRSKYIKKDIIDYARNKDIEITTK